jgi:CubicO group peptidase (beta-lactamase class C family)
MSRARFGAARALLAAAAESHAFPAAAIEVGDRHRPIWEEAFGRLTYAVDAPATGLDTIFDLASLTKVIATTPIAMRLIERGELTLQTRVTDRLQGWSEPPRDAIAIRHLLDHSSGLPGHASYWERTRGRAGFEAAIAAEPLLAPPGAQSAYSDIGFMLLGFILEDAGGGSLAMQFADLATRLGQIGFTPSASLRPRIAPTEEKPPRGLVWGEVHDENASALGGVAAHAGLFGTAAAVGAYARLVLRTMHEPTPLGVPETMRLFATRTGVPDSSRALGWDTMLPTSSCGSKISPRSIGHTGFTGTSLWIDLEREVYVVLLTNRVHPTRENQQLPNLRARIHDAIFEAL